MMGMPFSRERLTADRIHHLKIARQDLVIAQRIIALWRSATFFGSAL